MTSAKAVGDNKMARIGEVLASDASQANSNIGSFASQAFDTSSGSYGYGRSISDAVQVAMVIVDGASGLKSVVKAAAAVSAVAVDGVRTLMKVFKGAEKQGATEARVAQDAEKAAASLSTEQRVEDGVAGSQTDQTATNPFQDIRQSPRELSPAPVRKELAVHVVRLNG